MNKLKITETSYGADSPVWLRDDHGYEAADDIVLDSALFTGTFTDGYVPSGVTLGKVTATSKYGPYSDAAVDGRQVMVGHLKTARRVASTDPVQAAVVLHGVVVESKLPTNHGLDAAGKADVKGQLVYR